MQQGYRAWFYLNDGEQLGPVPEDVLRRMVRDSRLRSDSLVWTTGMSEWEEAGQVLPKYSALSQGTASPSQFYAPVPVAYAATDPVVSQATLSLALGLVSILGLLFFIQIPAGIVGLVLGIRSLHSSARGRAIAGTVLSSVGLLIFMWLAYGLVDVVRHVGFQPLLNEVLGR